MAVAFKFTRSADWPGSLSIAADRYEQAVSAVVAATTEEALYFATSRLGAACSAFGREMLALDKKRRPEMYVK